MGQTLTHGIYLPDEGERNCYNGLAGNWQILDGSVGTIAAHTSALAGKAPLVHTHTKSDITDFPAYGTTAGTICEGNDSRLSDARTPVAHTHTKSDVTDLFNSANTWSRNNTYSGNVNLYNSDNTQNTPTLYLRNSKATVSSSGNTAGYQGIYFNDSNNASFAFIRGAVQSNGCVINLKTIAKDSNNNTVENGIQIASFTDGAKGVVPTENGTISLGGTNYKWKTLNGINPGALSLPKVDGWNSGQDIDAAGIDTTNWDMSGGNWNELTNNVHDGWVYFAFRNCGASDRITVRYYGTDARFITLGFAALATGYMYAAFPLAKGFKANIAFTTSGTVMSKFIYPCIGNV